MTDQEIYNEIKNYFSIKELVSKTIYKKYGESAWKFICPRLLHTLLVIRKEAGRPIIINNWHSGGKLSQRGLRSNLGSIFLSKFKKGRLYLSAHVMGRAVDFDVKGMTSSDVRDWIEKIQHKLPYKIRLENEMNGKQISWVHLDMFWEAKNPKIYRFNI
tara:strand:- start:5053 stop:5529 length:477 start_codon:yes stop_codon:yes gene_type:complete